MPIYSHENQTYVQGNHSTNHNVKYSSNQSPDPSQKTFSSNNAEMRKATWLAYTKITTMYFHDP
jgi:hypothetical protein